MLWLGGSRTQLLCAHCRNEFSTAILEVVEQRRKKPSVRLLFFEKARADADVARRRNLGEGDDVIVVKRLRLSDQVAFESLHADNNALESIDTDWTHLPTHDARS